MNPEELDEENRLQEQLAAVTEQANRNAADAVEWMAKYSALHNAFSTHLEEYERAKDRAEEAELRARKAEDRTETLLLVLQHIVEGR